MAVFPFFNFTRGPNYQISPFLLNQDQLTELDGALVSYQLGAITKDLGYSRVSTQVQAGKRILGLFDFKQDTTTERVFAITNNAGDTALQLRGKTPAGAWSTIVLGGAWTIAAGATVVMEIDGFIGYAFFVGYDTTNNTFITPASVTGTTFSTVTNVTNMPNARYIKHYGARMYVANVNYGGTSYPYRVAYSNAVSAGAITWPVTPQFFDVDYGAATTGIEVNWNKLVIFTSRNGFMYDGSVLQQVWAHGCSNNRTIVNIGEKMFWCNGYDVCVSAGGQPELIGGYVLDFILNGNPQNYFSAAVDGEYWMYIGTVTVHGTTYTNTALIYNIATDSWRVREFNDNLVILRSYYDTTLGIFRLYMGDTSGNVWDKSKYTDATQIYGDSQVAAPSDSLPITGRFQITIPVPSDMATKGVISATAYANRAASLKLRYRILDRNVNVLKNWTPIGELTKFINDYDVNSEKGILLQLEGSDYSRNPYFSFYGLELEVKEAGKILKR